jgi:glutathione-specific gamma-glutamylcyclotransferase
MMDRPPGELWVFAYGSLMWRPDFDHVERAPVVIHGYHRALCMYSIEYRGTRETPGLVFGLDRGGACRGIAYRIAETMAESVLAALWEREMTTNIYLPRWLDTHLPDGRRVRVLAFVADPNHEQYAGKLDIDETVALVLQGCGKFGHCLEYLRNTLEHLEEMGIHDHKLHRIVQQAEHEQFQRGNQT